jgi:hypothetical protein
MDEESSHLLPAADHHCRTARAQLCPSCDVQLGSPGVDPVACLVMGRSAPTLVVARPRTGALVACVYSVMRSSSSMPSGSLIPTPVWCVTLIASDCEAGWRPLRAARVVGWMSLHLLLVLPRLFT